MMSLFSPFDFFYFFKNWVSFVFVYLTCTSSPFFLSIVSNFISTVSLSLSSFFYSLKSKSFNKFSEIIFISFIFLLVFMNFFSVFSYNFPFSSQVSIMMFFSLGVWVSMIIFSMSVSPQKFFYHFIPEGTPLPLTSLLFLIEVVSNMIRPITLMVRLVANILAGHLLMILLSKLVFNFYFCFPMYIGLNLVEIFVSLIQSYIFATMMVLYFSEV